jgi:uncharacterized membrane protein (DUF2068 family)
MGNRDRHLTTLGRPGHGALWLIGGFKLVKGLLLLAMALGALHLLHKDVAYQVRTWVAQLRVDPDNRLVDKAIGLLIPLDDRHLRAISAGTFFYAALLLTEGIGLLLRRRWAEYLTVVVTGSFIPLELYELWRHLTVTRLAIIVINVAIVRYLVGVLHRGTPEPHPVTV